MTHTKVVLLAAIFTATGAYPTVTFAALSEGIHWFAFQPVRDDFKETILDCGRALHRPNAVRQPQASLAMIPTRSLDTPASTPPTCDWITHAINYPPAKYPAEWVRNNTRLANKKQRQLASAQEITATKAKLPASEPSHSPSPAPNANHSTHQATAYATKAGMKTRQNRQARHGPEISGLSSKTARPMKTTVVTA
jgi:hypothetical protein